ncbi:MAG TPA: alpha/beta hydrolase [Azospirillaceae bacterium]|nr:alpha/beta hydrolase [Azospirillaceae bacterium]
MTTVPTRDRHDRPRRPGVYDRVREPSWQRAAEWSPRERVPEGSGLRAEGRPWGRSWGRLGLLGLAALLAGTAVLNQRRARAAERRHPPLGRMVEVAGTKLHVLERGNRLAPPVLLLHGNGSMVEDWLTSGVVERLSHDHRVIMLDRPGFGHSPRPRGTLWTARAQAAVIQALLAHLGVRRPVVVGHSWGTLVALSLALDHDLEMAGLVLVSGYYIPEARADVPVASVPAVPGLGDALRLTILPPVNRALTPPVLRKIFKPMPVPRDFLAGFPLELCVRPSQIRAMAEDTAFMTTDAARLSRRYGELRVPVTILAGEGDELITPARHAEPMARAVGARLRLLPGLGHMAHHGDPDAVADAVREVALARAVGQAAAPALAAD